jgi:hypothetical protein
MTFPLEYHSVVKHAAKYAVRPSVPASLALFGMLPLLLVSSSPAQNNNAASSGSVHAVSATPSVTSPSYNAHVSASSGVTSSTRTPLSTNGPTHTNPHSQPRGSNGQANYYPFVYAVPVPYSVDVTDAASSAADAEYQGGPTVFDRRGSGPDSYIPPVSASQAQDTYADDSNADPEPSPDPTVLVFKDGHQLEIDNYAIVSQTLYDLTPGHPHKIALADLDLPATQKQNDDRGVTFELPSSAQAN